MAFNSRFRVRTGPQRPKVGGDENAIVNKTAKTTLINLSRVTAKSGPQRPALGEVTTNAMKKQLVRLPGKTIKEEVGVKRGRSATLDSSSAPQRVPLGPKRPPVNVATSVSSTSIPNPAPLRAQRPTIIRPSETAPELHKPALQPTSVPPPVKNVDEADEDSMEIEEQEVVDEVTQAKSEEHLPRVEDEGPEDEAEDKVPVQHIWPAMSPNAAARLRNEIEQIQKTFHDEVDMFDTTMVSEYSDDIFEYMSNLEVSMMPQPDYMARQSEITWEMRQALVDWLLQVHLRYHLLPETLWIAVNIIDRFLSVRTVSIVKLQLVGVTAMFIAAKYEEILAPSVEEFIYMTENGYTKDEILRGERVILQALDFKVSSYCSPYSWMRKISKADDYDIQTRTLCKYLVEVTLEDSNFLRVKPSLVAAIGMYTARRMLGGDWNEAFVFYSGYTEEYLITGHNLIIEKLLEQGFEKQYVSRKYANKKFLKASVFAMEWARLNGLTSSASESSSDEMMEA